jgi:hypothetical protein
MNIDIHLSGGLLLGHIGMRNPSRMPQLNAEVCYFRCSHGDELTSHLCENKATTGVHGVDHFLPSRNVFVGVDAWGIRPLGALLADQDGLCQDEASATFSALLVVQLENNANMLSTDMISHGMICTRYLYGVAGDRGRKVAIASESCHVNAVWRSQIADLEWLAEYVGVGHWSVCLGRMKCVGSVLYHIIGVLLYVLSSINTNY